MRTDAQEVWLFTSGFPFGREEPFLESEVPVLAERFAQVRIFPLRLAGDQRPLPPNVSVEVLVPDPYRMATAGELLSRPFDVLRAVRSLLSDAPGLGALWAQRGVLRSRVRALIHRTGIVRDRLRAHGKGPLVLYSYWLHDWATVLALVRRKHRPWHIVARAHGFDLYAERSSTGWIPFRALQLGRLDRILCISQHGLRYLQSTYPAHTDKFVLARLGTADHGLAPWAPGSVLRIVSCSNLIPLKRVHLIAEAIRQVQVPVEWTHFGDGAERERIEALVRELPATITATLKGSVPNADILDHYRTHPVDVFVHLSSNEGLPVVLMEATSFGIPVLACDVGGVSELVNERTGTLLPKDVPTTTVAGLLNGMLGSKMHDAVFRAGVRAAWAEGFRAATNFERTCDELVRS